MAQSKMRFTVCTALKEDLGAKLSRQFSFVKLSSTLVLLTLLGCQQSSAPAPSVTPNEHAVKKLDGRWHLDTIPFTTSSPSASREPRADDVFADISKVSGIDFAYHNGREGFKFTLIESIGGGAALFDFDGDNVLELFIVGGGTIAGSPIVIGGSPCGFFRNRGDLTFDQIAKSCGIEDSPNYTLACNVCDYNCDGQPDLFVTGYPRCRLYCNQGDGTFQDDTERTGLVLEGLHAASAWGDFNGDGFPDLFVTGYAKFDLREDRQCGEDLRHIRDICGVSQYPPAPDRLFMNLGNGTFEETTRSAELRVDGRGLGAVAADINFDGHLDLYVANDTTPNFLYLGDGHGKFRECGLESGAALDENGSPQGSMGVDFGDYNGDGLGDLFVTNYQLEDNSLYRNLGDANFSVATRRAGLQDICRPYVGFGTGWVDWNSDGWLDLFVLNGHIMYHTGQSPYEQPAFLFRNIEGERFENVSERGGSYFASPHVGRGGAVGDLNNDGAFDLIAIHQNAPVSVLRNQHIPTRWISVCLRGTKSEPFAAGAVVTSRFAGRDLVRHVRNGPGYFSSFDRRIILPVDDVETGECSVRWLDGTTEVFRNLTLGQTNQLIEGQGDRLQ